MNRFTPVARAAASRISVPAVRSSFVRANQSSNRRRSGSRARALIWWMTASGSARATASPTPTASRPSTTTGSAPSARSPSSLSWSVVVAVTWCPRATSCGVSRRPIAPLPPARSTRIVRSFHSSWSTSQDERGHLAVTSCLALAHEPLARGTDERHRLGEEDAHCVAQRDRLFVRAAICLHLAERGGGELNGRVQRQRGELLALS